MRTNFSPRQRSAPAIDACEGELRKCTHCGFCTATCPTYLLLGDELDSPRGRIYLIKNMLEGEQTPSSEVVKHLDRCLSCLACVTACPSGVNYMHLIDHARSYVEHHYRRPWRERAWRALLAAILPHPRRLRWALAAAPLMRRWLPSRGRALAPLRAMLALAPNSRPARAQTVALPAASAKPRVALLAGCVEPVLRPEIRAACVRLLERAGFAVGSVSGEGCCGALVHHLGREGAARAAARRNVEAWSEVLEHGELAAIIVTAAGCGTMLKDYGFLLRDEPQVAARAARVSALALDVCELLDRTGLPPPQRHTGLKVAYLSACSLQHGQGVSAAPKRLLSAAGFDVVEPRESHLCCGSAGTYNVLQSELSQRLRARKLEHLVATGAQVLAAGNIGCLTQIGAAAGMPAVHTIELLDWATGGPLPPALASDRALPFRPKLRPQIDAI